MRKWPLRLFLILGIFGSSAPASADSWALPTAETYVSQNGQYRLVVVPREIESQLAFFEDKVDGKEPAGSARRNAPSTAIAKIEQFELGSWRTLWVRPLLNDVAPVKALVSNDGQSFVTFDNWHMVGLGEHVLVIYGGEARPVRSFQLSDLVPDYFIDALPGSVSSVRWRNGEGLSADGRWLELAIKAPSTRDGEDETKSLMLRISMENGAPDLSAADAVSAYKEVACFAHRRNVARTNEMLVYDRSDLVLPDPLTKENWSRYLYQLMSRISDGNDENIFGEANMFELLAPRGYMAKEFSETFSQALTVSASKMPVRTFASIDQMLMVKKVEKEAKKIKAQHLDGSTLRFIISDEFWPRIQTALLQSGATMLQIDPSDAVPQKPEKLAELPDLAQVDAACR